MQHSTRQHAPFPFHLVILVGALALVILTATPWPIVGVVFPPTPEVTAITFDDGSFRTSDDSFSGCLPEYPCDDGDGAVVTTVLPITHPLSDGGFTMECPDAGQVLVDTPDGSATTCVTVR